MENIAEEVADLAVKKHIEAIGRTHINAKISALNELLAEILEHDFDTVSQVKGLIHTNLEILEKVKSEKGFGDE